MNRELDSLRFRDLKTYLKTNEPIYPAEEFRRFAPSLGFQRSKESEIRLNDFISAFVDQERRGFIDLTKIQEMLDNQRASESPT